MKLLLRALAIACAVSLLPGQPAWALAAAQDAPQPQPPAQEAAPPQEPAAPPAAPPQAAPEQESPAPAEAGQPPVQQPAVQQLQPSKPPATLVPIEDIAAARGEGVTYVRRRAHMVESRLGHLDVEADPVLHVGDEPISRSEFRRRALMYMAGNEIDREVTRALTEQEIRKRLAAGEDPAAFALDEAAIDRKIEEQKELITMQANQQGQAPGAPLVANPGQVAIDAFLASIESSPGGMPEYRKLLAADVQFERVFLPIPATAVEGVKHDPATGPPPADEARPDWMPQASWDAFSKDDPGRSLRSMVKTWSIEGTGIPSFFKPSIVSKLREGLVADVGLDFFYDADLPPDVFLRVGDEQVNVDDMWARAAVQIADADIDLVLRELLMLRGMKAALEKEGRWMEREPFRERWGKHEAEYAATLFPLKTIIIFKGYTSVDRYREHYRYRIAFNDWRRESVTDEDVRRHYEQGGRLFFERGDALVDVAFAPLGDRPFNDTTLGATLQELLDAMEAARSAAGDAPTVTWFAKVKEQYPAPKTDQSPDNIGFQRSQLRMLLGEDELSIFLTGYSLADDVIYHGLPGDLVGPWPRRCRRHAWGAEPNAGSSVVLVNGYRARAPLAPFEDRNKEMAWEDYLDLNYFDWSQQCLLGVMQAVKAAPPPPAPAVAPRSTSDGGSARAGAADTRSTSEVGTARAETAETRDEAPQSRTWLYILGAAAVIVVVAAVRRK